MNEAETRADFKICHFDRREKSQVLGRDDNGAIREGAV